MTNEIQVTYAKGWRGDPTDRGRNRVRASLSKAFNRFGSLEISL